MGKRPRRGALLLLATLLLFLLLAVEVGGAEEEDPGGAPTHGGTQAGCTDEDPDEERPGGRFGALLSGTPRVQPEPCAGRGEVKRSADVDYHGFVGLMGRRRNAAEPCGESAPPHSGEVLILMLPNACPPLLVQGSRLASSLLFWERRRAKERLPGNNTPFLSHRF